MALAYGTGTTASMAELLDSTSTDARIEFLLPSVVIRQTRPSEAPLPSAARVTSGGTVKPKCPAVPPFISRTSIMTTSVLVLTFVTRQKKLPSSLGITGGVKIVVA